MALPFGPATFTGVANGTGLAAADSRFTVLEGGFIVNSEAVGTSNGGGTDCTAVINSETFDSDHWCQAIARRGNVASSSNCGIAIRVSGTGANIQGYRFIWPDLNGTDCYLSRKAAGGSWTNKTPSGEADIFLTPAPADGDVVKMTGEAGVIKIYYNGVLKFTWTDPSPLSGGAAGLGGWGYSADAWSRADSIEAGNMVVAGPAPVLMGQIVM